MRLDAGSALRALSWHNYETGRTISLGPGTELEVEIDSADHRVWVPGWKAADSRSHHSNPDQDPGLDAGFARPEFDDSSWRGMINLTLGKESATEFTWARAKIEIPADGQGKPLYLVLGGLGLLDHRFMRVFLNGQAVGTRQARKRWHEPLEVELKPESPHNQRIAFGKPNVIAVQVSEFMARPARLDELDPQRSQSIPGSLSWPFSPAPFEQYATIGRPYQRLVWNAPRIKSHSEGAAGELVIEMDSRDGHFSALLTYRWKADQPVLHKFVQIKNRSTRRERILQVRLGEYSTSSPVSEGEQGFPVYLAGEFFMGLAHPFGWAMGQDKAVSLRQYPGALLEPGEEFHCMEAVYGVSGQQGARDGFLSHLEKRMRRTVRAHDNPRALFEPFGARPGNDNFDETEEFLLDNIRRVAEGQQESGCHLDAYSLDFWVDYNGDLIRFDPKRFPRGPGPVLDELKKLGTAPGLWIDSTWERWSIGGNPAVQGTFMNDPQYGTEWKSFCRATEPVKSLYSTAFRHHIRENGVRQIKFDNFRALCSNEAHSHWPGIYSMEPVGNSVIETLRDLDRENPDVFLMLYWGYRSPWWLLHGDTLFESGLAMEAASPGHHPTLYARASVTVSLDQGLWYCEDVPRLGKDSLGVWLSDWGWNSSIGKERWQEGFVMDICRGSMLAQPWSDTAWLSPPERRQMADFIALMKAQPECFRNSRFIVGNPWKNEPYGHLCSDGKRAFLALNNCTWQDASIDLELNKRWGLPEGKSWNLFRWYPKPAALGSISKYLLRLFEVVLLEAVQEGEAPTLGRKFAADSTPLRFDEASVELELQVSTSERKLSMRGNVPATRSGGTLVVAVEMHKDSKAWLKNNIGKLITGRGAVGGREVAFEPVLGLNTYPSSWQAWRARLEPLASQSVEFEVSAGKEIEAELLGKAYFVPA
jgi:hypothetical protein